MKAGKHR